MTMRSRSTPVCGGLAETRAPYFLWTIPQAEATRMESPVRSGAELVGQAVASLRTGRPHYRQMLDYYEQVMSAQETVKAAMSRVSLPDPLPLVDEAAEETGGFAANTVIGLAAGPARDLLAAICAACRTSGAHSPAMVRRLEQVAVDGGSAFGRLLQDFLLRDWNAVERFAAAHELDRGFLMHVIHNSLLPAIQIWSQGVAAT